MALYYFETSALFKLYVREDGTERMVELVKGAAGDEFCILAVSMVELRSAIRRRQRNGDISAKVADQVLDLFEMHLEDLYLIKAIDDQITDSALRLVDRHNLKAYDALQLAGCLELRGQGKLVFVCSDQELLQAARAEKLTVFDPGAAS